MSDPKIPATEFKAKCLALIDRVRERGEPITITKHGHVVARLVPAGEEDEKPWLRLRRLGPSIWHGDPFAPAVTEDEIEAIKPVPPPQKRPARPPKTRSKR